MANPNLKEETLCEKSTSQEARGLQNTRVKEEKLSPTVGRRKISSENAPLVVGRTERQGKLRNLCCGVEVRKTTWGTIRKIPPLIHSPKAAAGKVTKSRRSRRSSTSFKDLRKITKRTKEPSPTSNTLPSPEYLLSPEKSPEIAGRTEKGGEA